MLPSVMVAIIYLSDSSTEGRASPEGHRGIGTKVEWGNNKQKPFHAYKATKIQVHKI